MLKQRVITALALVGILLPILFWLPPIYATAVFIVIAALAAWEWSRMTLPSTPSHLLFPAIIVACCGASVLFPAWQLPVCLFAAVAWLLVPLWLFNGQRLRGGVISLLVGIVLIVPTFIAMSRLHVLGPWVLLAAMALVWVADIAAYFAGRKFGRHKLAVTISSGKTWEGAAGALAGSLVYASLLQKYAYPQLPSNMALLYAGTAILVAISIVGDLFESMIKRQAGVKDSSQLLPGHGGVMDRIDSLTSTLPVMVAMSSLLSP